MFRGNEFTLDTFKNMIDSEEDLHRFKQIINNKRDEILNAALEESVNASIGMPTQKQHNV